MNTEFTLEEAARLSPFFTNVDAPVFGLKLPQDWGVILSDIDSGGPAAPG